MGIWYATREDVKSALDYKETARNNVQVDRAIEAASRVIENDCHRLFYPTVGVRRFDWPNYQYARSWRLWLDENDVISLTSLVSGGVTIPASAYNLEPVNTGPPYSSIEIKLSSSSALSAGATWQQSTVLTGLFGYSNDEGPAGALAADCTSSATTIQVTDSASVGVGQLLRLGTERLNVTDKTSVTTGKTLQTPVTAAMADNLLATGAGNGVSFTIGETVTLDAERMRIVDILGDSLNVIRAWDGSVLAAHNGSAIYAPRRLTVTRGALGTTAAAGTNGDAVVKWLPPGPVRELAIAYACNSVLNESAGYARTIGSGATQRAATTIVANIGALTAQVNGTYGRKARSRAV